MIVTLTTNPSLDRTGHVRTPLERGVMQRLGDVGIEPGGKGINLARCVQLAGQRSLAVLPAAPREQILTLLEMRGVPFTAVDVASSVRTNLTVMEPDGTVTKLNEPGGEISAQEVNSIRGAVLAAAERASWVVLAGSLPPGVPSDFYTDLVRALRELPVQIALDTSDVPLMTAARAWPFSAPDLFAPNLAELAQASGTKVRSLRAALDEGEWNVVANTARGLVERGVGAVIVSLAEHGAILVTPEGAWMGVPAPVQVVSTAGSGDASLAGYLLAEKEGVPPVERLRRAVAYGTASVTLEGAGVPAPQHLDPESVTVTHV